MPRRAAAEAVAARGGIVRRGLTRRTSHLVIGHGAHRLIAGGRLAKTLVESDRLGATCLSENAFLRLIDGIEAAEPSQRPFPLQTLIDKTGLNIETIRLLGLFDVIALREETVGFRDLVAAKEVARLLAEGIPMADLLASVDTLRRRSGPGEDLARVHLARTDDGEIGLRLGEAVAELDGQMRLPLSRGDNPSVDALFEAASEAEEVGAWGAAERLYRRCLTLDRSDPIAAFNLANVLREQGRPQAARFYFKLALALDPGFAEAWYNLADLAEQAGLEAEARACLGRALGLDPDYADALYNLAQLEYRREAYGRALACWERYLSLDDASDWSHTAREGVALCRQKLQEANQHS